MDNKRERIVDAARKRFRYYGIKKTTIREVAADAEIAVGTLYLYFRDKDELVVACAEDFAARHRRQAEEILASDASPDEKLRQYLVTRYREAEETRTSSRHAVELAREVLRLKPDRIQEEGMIMWETIVQILKIGNSQRMFQIAEPEADARVLLYSVGFFYRSALSEVPPVPPEEDLLLVINWFIEAWKRPKGAPPKSPSTARKQRG
jgi:AcrR family transcriptional regulator